MISVESRTVWALQRKKDKTLLNGTGNYLAPWIFGDREGARRGASECREHGIAVKPIRVKVTVIVQEAR